MAATTSELIATTDVGVRLGDRWILKHINMVIRRGELVTLIGPNGAGKTTLVRVVLGLLKPTTGQVHKNRISIGYMPQRLQISISMPLCVVRFLKLAGHFTTKEIDAALTRAGAGHVGDTPLYYLSGGEFQRVLLARALLRRPDLLVLDEPAQGVDITGQVELYQTIADIRHELGCGVLMVSHDLHLVMAATDTVYCLNHHICCQGRPEAVSRDPAYIELFGIQDAKAFAIYRHEHDHEHGTSGDVLTTTQSSTKEDDDHAY